MCDLLGVSSRYPVTVDLSFQKLMERAKTENPDGWGAVFYEQNDAYVFREPRPGRTSQLAGLLSHCGVECELMLSHIRKATGGAVELRNTHPFVREVHGRLHSFAFNGDVPGIFDIDRTSGQFWPIGETDGEHAFCLLLEQLSNQEADSEWVQTATLLQSLGDRLAKIGPTNFLYSDSRYLYAFASRRRHQNGEYPPGLYYLNRHCDRREYANSCIGLSILSPQDYGQKNSVLLFASVPLSDEGWIPFDEGQLIVAKQGEILQEGGVDCGEVIHG